MPEDPEKGVWVDFDVAVPFSSEESMGPKGEEYSQYKAELVASFGELLVCLILPSLVRKNLTVDISERTEDRVFLLTQSTNDEKRCPKFVT